MARTTISALSSDEQAHSEGWLPANPDDPFLIELFEQYWDVPAET